MTSHASSESEQGQAGAEDKPTSEDRVYSCLCCGNNLRYRFRGGRERHYCSLACRRIVDRLGRAYVRAALAVGRLSMDDLRSPPDHRASPSEGL